jgi:hypothetical protein
MWVASSPCCKHQDVGYSSGCGQKGQSAGESEIAEPVSGKSDLMNDEEPVPLH